LNNTVDGRPVGHEFVKYLPWFLEDNPGVTCPKGFVLLVFVSGLLWYVARRCHHKLYSFTGFYLVIMLAVTKVLFVIIVDNKDVCCVFFIQTISEEGF